MRQSILSLGLAVVGIFAACKSDNRPAAENPVRWTITQAEGSLRPGSMITVRLTAAIDSGWYVYSVTQKLGGPTPMTIMVTPSPPFRVEGDILGPKPIVVFDKEFGIDTERYEGNPDFTIAVAVAPTPDARPDLLSVGVRYQACNASFCLPARTKVLNTPIRMVDPARTANRT